MQQIVCASSSSLKTRKAKRFLVFAPFETTSYSFAAETLALDTDSDSVFFSKSKEALVGSFLFLSVTKMDPFTSSSTTTSIADCKNRNNYSAKMIYDAFAVITWNSLRLSSISFKFFWILFTAKMAA